MVPTDVFMKTGHPMQLSDSEFGDYVPKGKRSFLQEVQICEADLDAVKGSKKRRKHFKRR
jgi:hypothetical protein